MSAIEERKALDRLSLSLKQIRTNAGERVRSSPPETLLEEAPAPDQQAQGQRQLSPPPPE